MLPSKDRHTAKDPEVKSARGEGCLLASNAVAGSSGGAGCCWERPGLVSSMVTQSSASDMLPSKDMHAARGPEDKSSLVEGVLQALSALAGAPGGFKLL